MSPTVKKQIEDFYAAHKADVDSLANYLGVPPLWVVSTFHLESSLNPNAVNSVTGAVGLNQMLPSTLADLNSSVTAYKQGGVPYQLLIMKDFFAPIRGKIKRAGDLYLYNFYPAAVKLNYPMDFPIGKNGDMTLRYGTSLDRIYDANAGLDQNRDGILSRQDIVSLFETRYDELVKGAFFFRDLWIDFKTNWLAWVLVLVLLAVALGYIIYKM